MKISVAEVEPFGSDENGIKGEEEGVVELLVFDLGGEHDEKG